MAFLARRSYAEKHGLPILAKFTDYTVVGCEPHLFGKSPAMCITKLLERNKITKADIDIFEVNEAFASFVVYTMEELDLDWAKVNPNGGAVAIGHPLACSEPEY